MKAKGITELSNAELLEEIVRTWEAWDEDGEAFNEWHGRICETLEDEAVRRERAGTLTEQDWIESECAEQRRSTRYSQ
jgi:hypothetical protein